MVPDVDATSYTVTARKDRPCDEYPRCNHGGIKTGEDYVRHATFPGHEANQSNRVVVHCICRHCHTQYDRPMPPRRAARKKARRG